MGGWGVAVVNTVDLNLCWCGFAMQTPRFCPSLFLYLPAHLHLTYFLSFADVFSLPFLLPFPHCFL